MAQASALPKCADGHTLAHKIALHLKQGPAFILVSGCDNDSCKIFLDSLSAELSGTGRTVSLHSPASSANLFDLVANSLGLGLTPASASSLAKHLGEGNTYLLCSMGEESSLDTFEQLRQLSNLQPTDGHLSIILCGGPTLPKRLPKALRQRVTDTYRLDTASSPLRTMVWGLSLSTLCIGVWLVHSHFPGVFSFATQPQLDSKQPLKPSLKAGAVLAHPIPVEPPMPLTHIFQTEAEAEAALQAQLPAEKPDQE
jgi:hypothetical protein